MELTDTLMPTPQQWLIIASLAVAVSLAWLMTRRRRPKDESPRQYRREIDSAVARGQSLNRDLEALLAELEQFSQRLHEQLDAKVVDLGRVLAEADIRIATLRGLLEEAGRISDATSSTAETPEPPPSVDDPTVATSTATQSNTPETSPDRQTALESVPGLSTLDERRQRIAELADRGLLPVQIAQQLGQPVGEVELILNLRETLSPQTPR